MQCPVCNVPLTMSERQGVEIDYCPKCRGVWLDRGELDKIIARNATEAAPANGGWQQPAAANQAQHAQQQQYQAPPQQQGWQGQASHPQKRRRSFLEDLFD